MKDEALEKIWKTRESISAECGFDSRRIVKYLQERTKKRNDEPDRGQLREDKSQGGGVS